MVLKCIAQYDPKQYWGSVPSGLSYTGPKRMMLISEKMIAQSYFLILKCVTTAERSANELLTRHAKSKSSAVWH